MNDIKINDLYDLEKTIAKDVFEGAEYPWEVLSKIKEYILKLGGTLSLEEYDHPQEDVWISKTAKVFPSAYIGGPCIIDHEAEVRHSAFIRGSAIVGKNCDFCKANEQENRSRIEIRRGFSKRSSTQQKRNYFSTVYSSSAS